MKRSTTAAIIFLPMFYAGMFLPDTRSSYCKILCLDAILQTRVFTGFRLDCRAEKSNECYQNLCRLVNKHPTSECPGICRFTAAEYNRIGMIDPRKGGRMSPRICSNPAWTTTTSTFKRRKATTVTDFRSCTSLCEYLFPRILELNSRCPYDDENTCYHYHCNTLLKQGLTVVREFAVDACPTLCMSMAAVMERCEMECMRKKNKTEIFMTCSNIDSTSETTTMPSPTWFPATPPGTDFSDCRNHCEHLFREILRNYPSCTHSDEHQCYYENCVQLLNGKVEAARKDIEEECPQICSTMGHAMPDIDVAKDMSRMEIRRFCLESLERTTNSPTTITYPNEEFSDCKELCENVFPITLKPRKFFCEDKGKPFNPCVLSSCKKSISRVSMDNGQDGKDACPKMCSTMAVAMRGRDMNRRLFSRKKIEEFCSKIVSTSEGTTNSPTTTAITYPNEEFSDCKELCENVFPKTLKPREFFCEDEGKPFNPCVLSSCKKIISRILMEDGQDGEDACPKMCSSMATAMRGRNMDRRKLSKEKIQKFCSKIVSTSEGTTNSPTTTAITYPNEEFSNCKELCEYVFPKILKSKEFLCEDKGKPFNPCVLSSCKKSISRVSMDNGQDGKDACPKMCSTMAVAMRGRDMNRRLFSRKKIEEFCSKIVSTSEGTTNSPTTTAITYPNEEFSNCKELCEYVFPKILKSKEFLCDHKEKPFNPCILSSCKKVTCQTFMGDGQDANDACPSMCWSIAVAMRGRDMDRRHFDKDKIREFCSSINSTSGRATNPPTSAVATCPNEKFSNCRDLCEYALTETLSDHPRLCWEQKKSASLCIHYACEIVVRQNLMLEHVCPQMCPSMIAAVRDVEKLDSRSKNIILGLCSSVSMSPRIFPGCPITDTDIPTTTTEKLTTTTETLATTTKMPDTTTKMPDTTKKMPDTTKKMPDTTKKMPDTTTEMPL